MAELIVKSGSYDNLTITSSLVASGSVKFLTLTTPPTTVSNVLMLSSSGQVFITASSALGGGTSGVTQIVAGPNITLSPIGGTGVVTISASAGGGTPGGNPSEI